MATATYPSTKERTNYARLCRAIVDLCTDVLREVLSLQVVPSKVLVKLRTCELGSKPFSADEILKINKGVQNSSYKNLDISLLYRIITVLSVQELRDDLFQIIPAKEVWNYIQKDFALQSTCTKEQLAKLKYASSQGNYSCCDCDLLMVILCNVRPGYSKSILPSKKSWGGNMPSTQEVEFGDDIERIRILRNKVYGHVSDTNVSDKECNKIFQELIGIMSRMDQRLKSKGQFSKAISEIETSPIDNNWDKYIAEIKVLDEADKTVRLELEKTKENVEEMRQDLTMLGNESLEMQARIQGMSATEKDLETNLTSHNVKLTQVEKRLCEVEQHVKSCGETEENRKDTIEKLQNDMSKLLKRGSDNYVAKHIKEQNKLIMAKWKIEDKVFLETKATKQVFDSIKQSNYLTVTGNGGTGKSANIRHVTLQLERQGYQVFVIHSPSEMKAYLNPECKQLYVIDDPVGIHILDKTMFNVWLMYDDILNQCLVKADVKFLCSIRKQIVNDPEFMKERCILNKYIIDLQGTHCLLDPCEKIAMFKQHMAVNNCRIEITEAIDDILIQTDEKFPILCKIFFSEKKFQTVDFIFFVKPFSLFLKELNKLKSSDKKKYCILVLCFTNGNSFMPSMFDPFEQSDAKMDSFLGACGVNRNEFIESLDDNLCALTDVFLTKEGDVYRFSHDVIHDVVAFHFGQKFPKQMIKFSQSRFLCERVVLNAEMAQDDPYVVILQRNLSDALLERLLEDLESQIYDYVITNKCWKDELFMQLFEKKLESDKDSILGLFMRETGKIPDYVESMFKDLQNLCPQNTWTWHFRAMDLLRFSGITALHWVVTFGNTRLFENIWKHLSSDKRKNISRNFPLLHFACLGGDVDICRAILSDKNEFNKINTPFSENLTSAIGESFICDYLPLHLAAMNNVDVVKLLLDQGAEINMTHNKGELAGRSALVHASGRGKTDIVLLLIKRGANTLTSNEFGPLESAIYNNHPNVVKLLLDNHAYVDKEDKNGVTPLMKASFWGHVQIVELLLQYKPDVNKKNKYGRTALEYAKYQSNTEIVDILQRYKKKGFNNV